MDYRLQLCCTVRSGAPIGEGSGSPQVPVSGKEKRFFFFLFDIFFFGGGEPVALRIRREGKEREREKKGMKVGGRAIGDTMDSSIPTTTGTSWRTPQYLSVLWTELNISVCAPQWKNVRAENNDAASYRNSITSVSWNVIYFYQLFGYGIQLRV